ncbi:FAD-binding oxidoreductase [Agromyces sp. SYSU K20354]|uniref:FAD-binding oxidoreductase n=1 Tax=Agromyces cavernae TaxID=2898659 RepID=UPI001E3DFEEC|nr:FAD-binding oxidoreductase [Agromyces cavernae]MCD2443572.1 FAD-binding oxidoreductase [Agromyces cavernae]
MALPEVARRTLIGDLRARVRGTVIGRDHPEYDHARAVWNGLIDRHPEVVVRCADVDDVVACVDAARVHRPIVSIRGGGHQVAGSAVCDDGLVIDLSGMRDVVVDPVARTARVQGGARWADVDAATQAFGLAAPGGEVSETGVAGLTLGGGLGLLQRTHGLSCDNVLSMTVVTADGVVRTASADEHADLYWALRGAGRGLGVVTEFTFALHPLGPDVAAAAFVYAPEDAGAVFRSWRQLAAEAPPTIAPEFALWALPPVPGLPDEIIGVPVALAFGTFIGAPADAATALEPFSRLGEPILDLSGTTTWVEAQSQFDFAIPDGGRYYWKSHFMDEPDDATIDLIVGHAARRPDPNSAVFVRTLGGAVDRIGSDETAFAHRGARFNVSVDAIWSDPALDDDSIGWARGLWNALEPVSRGMYLNFAGLGEEEGAVGGLILGAHEERVRRIRRTYDPEGVFESAAARP